MVKDAVIVNKRIANKYIWSIEDIQATVLHALVMMDIAVERAQQKCSDPALMLALAELKGDLCEIRVLAIGARRGEYTGKGRIQDDDVDEEE